jgi:NAD(P)-dependent dehydrogenase (short-subunit alcohol dehydrogenase family)
MSASTPATPTRSVLVTGGSRGIGAATALLAAKRGWAVAVNYTSDAAAARTIVARIGETGGTAIAVQADVSIEAAVLEMFARVDAELPRLDALVNNAGVVDLAGRVDETTTARLQRMFAINVFGSFICAREAAAAARS